MVVVEVQGGVVQSVYSDDDEAEVVVVDHDEAAAGGVPAWTADVMPIEAMSDKAMKLKDRGLAIEAGEIEADDEELTEEADAEDLDEDED